jgi:hypothetical protein
MSNIGPGDAVRESSPIEQVHNRLHAEIEQLEMAVSTIENRLAHATSAHNDPPNNKPEAVGPDAPGSSDHVITATNAADNVAGLTERVRRLINRLEV